MYGRKMIVFGGESEDGRLNELWEYDIDMNKWTMREQNAIMLE